VTCRITHVTSFGAFAALEEGVEGLIHISELADGPFSHPRNIVTEGEELTARVISVESGARRLALSLRHPNPMEESPTPDPFEPSAETDPTPATETDPEG
jgi:small subunit ribosomal protein S1